MPEPYTEQYLRNLLASPQGIDAVFFSKESSPEPALIAQFGALGELAPLDDLIAQHEGLQQSLASYSGFSLQQAIRSPGGRHYYLPAFDPGLSNRQFQTLWINVGWLDDLNLALPSDTAAFSAVLEAFQSAHPEGAALIGSADAGRTSPLHFLINPFAPSDPAADYFVLQEGQLSFSPITEAYREGLMYCRDLHARGLLADESFSYGTAELISLANDPSDLLGAFCAGDVSAVLSPHSPELLSRFWALHPLQGPEGSARTTLDPPRPLVGGVIPAHSQHIDEAFNLMALMCSEEAALISHYGEPGLDWDYAQVGDISASGTPALITIHNQDPLQREALAPLVGPYIQRSDYADAVAWKGYQVNQSSYLNARATRSYEPYLLKQPLSPRLLLHDEPQLLSQLDALKAHTDAQIAAFASGALDVYDDAQWQAHIDSYDALFLAPLQTALQSALDDKEVAP